MLSWLFYHNSLEWSVSSSRMSNWFLLLLYLDKIPVVNANSVDPDQMLHSAAGLHCLPVTLLGVSSLKCDNGSLQNLKSAPELKMFPTEVEVDPAVSTDLDNGVTVFRKHHGIMDIKTVRTPERLEEAANTVLESRHHPR